ncbi:hypothetical protein [Streptomyces katrae]|nr:hypothetical protein [Streptomyces katrae]
MSAAPGLAATRVVRSAGSVPLYALIAVAGAFPELAGHTGLSPIRPKP